jgi:hypothetical protein
MKPRRKNESNLMGPQKRISEKAVQAFCGNGAG